MSADCLVVKEERRLLMNIFAALPLRVRPMFAAFTKCPEKIFLRWSNLRLKWLRR